MNKSFSLMWKMLVLTICFISASSKTYALSPSTPAVVEQFYGTMKKMCDATSETNAYNCRVQLTDCFRGKESSGIWTPNDFFDWGYKDYTKVPANQYANIFYQLSFQKKLLRIENYKIESNQYVSEVDLKQFRRQSGGLIQTIVTKTFTDGKIKKTFTDTLIVDRNEIVVFKNSVSTDDGEDIDALRALAASYYTTKQYYKAYKTYEKIIQIDPKNANAYYRLGLMTYWRKGCYYSKSTAHKKGLEYAEKSLSLGYYNADAAIYYMTHGQPI